MHHFTERLSAQSVNSITICFAMETFNRRACSNASSAKQLPDGSQTVKVAHQKRRRSRRSYPARHRQELEFSKGR